MSSNQRTNQTSPRAANVVDDYNDDYDEDDFTDVEDEYVMLPRVAKSSRKILGVLVAFLAVIGIVGAISTVWISNKISGPGGSQPEITSLVVPQGTTLNGVGDILEENEVISSARVFKWYTKWKKTEPPGAGNYIDFKKNMSMDDAITVLDDGPVPIDSLTVTIIPGMWLSNALDEIVSVFPDFTVDQLNFVLATGEVKSKYLPDGQTNWEGFLLPQTYAFESDATPESVLQRIVDEFDDTLDSLGYDDADSIVGRSAYDLVTIASMIEREAGEADGEREKISQVISNRLDDGTTLGIDATTLYGFNKRNGGLTKEELESDNPYNTRRVKGLPPTPIALPSEPSLAAAISPAEGPWLYYVLQNDNPTEHFFTDDYDEFLAAKKRAQDAGYI